MCCFIELRDLCQRKHLVSHTCGAIHRASQFDEGNLRRHIAALRVLHLRLQHSQRRAQLMRRISHESLSVVVHSFQPRHHFIQRFNNGRELARCGRSDGSQRIMLALQKFVT